MDREESIALFLRGRDAWNAWAGKMLAGRKALEAEGSWAARIDWRGALEPQNEKTRSWAEAAKADFADAGFETASWPKMRLPPRPVPLEANRIDFEGFVFPSDAVFDRVTFCGDAYFKGAVFCGIASFERASFSGDALFQRATFSGPAWFHTTAFGGDAVFEGGAFPASAWFDNAFFRRAADFRHAVAESTLSLAGTRFEHTVPDFRSARLAAPPVFDKLRLSGGVEPGLFLQSVAGGFFLWIMGLLDATLIQRYRTLKRLAALPDDYRNERLFARGELRSRRYTEDKPWHAAFWFGILYELLSGFGRSISRPILWLIVLTAVSSWFYLGRHAPAGGTAGAQLQARIAPYLPGVARALLPAAQPGALPKLSCKYGDGDPVAAAALLAVRQGSAIGAFGSANSSGILACLYGFDEKLRAPAVPGAVVLWGIGQTVLSAALLFLFLLALRNQFKIK